MAGFSVTVPDVEDEEATEEPPEQLTPFVRRVALIAALSGALFGFDSGVIASVLVAVHSDLNGRELTLGEEELIVSGLTFGALLGAILASWASDRFGRKKTILAAAALFTLGAIEQAAAQIVKELVLGRVIVGLGVGLASMVTPVYLAELTPSVWRGRVVSLLTVCITFGQVVAYIVGASLYSVESGWRFMLLSGAVPSIAQLVLSFAMPDSPRWQVQKGQIAQAKATLSRIYPATDAQGIEAKVASIERTLQTADKQTLHLGASRRSAQTLVDALWRDLPTRRALFVACSLQAIQQLTGFNALMYFSARFLRTAGFSRPAIAALPIAISNFIGTLISLRLIDRLGRRPMLQRSLLGMTIGHLLIGLAFIFVGDGPGGFASWITLLAMIAFCTSYALGVGNVPWCIQSEIFDLHVRSIGNGMATASNWLSNLLAAGTFLHLTAALTASGAFWLYAGVCLLSLLYVQIFVPETAGLSLEECRSLFETGDVVKTVRRQQSQESYQAINSEDAVPLTSADASAEV